MCLLILILLFKRLFCLLLWWRRQQLRSIESCFLICACLLYIVSLFMRVLQRFYFNNEGICFPNGYISMDWKGFQYLFKDLKDSQWIYNLCKFIVIDLIKLYKYFRWPFLKMEYLSEVNFSKYTVRKNSFRIFLFFANLLG